MLSWCAYCQEFQGELPPFETFEISHGMCTKCAVLNFTLGAVSLDHARSLQRIQSRLARAGRQANRAEIEAIVDEAVDAGIRPVDILVGLAAPLLYETGKAWEAAELSVADEHRFTAFCENAYEVVEARLHHARPAAVSDEVDPHVEIVVVNAPGNRHTLATRVLALWLMSSGRKARAIPPQASLPRLVDLIVAAEPQIVAISLALPEQRVGAEALIAQVRERAPGIRLVVGGNAVKLGMCGEIAGASLLADIAAL